MGDEPLSSLFRPGKESLGKKSDAGPTVRYFMRKIIVLPDDSGWAVKLQGNFASLSTHWHQVDAIRAGRKIAARQAAELVVYNEDCELVDASRLSQPTHS